MTWNTEACAVAKSFRPTAAILRVRSDANQTTTTGSWELQAKEFHGTVAGQAQTLGHDGYGNALSGTVSSTSAKHEKSD